MLQFLTAFVAIAATGSSAPVTEQLSRPARHNADSSRSAPAIFGALAIPAHSDRISAQWLRASLDASSDPRITSLIAPALGLPPTGKLAYVQSAGAHLIHWRSDATQWGEQDYWASAAETLRSGAGDEEDRAIVKMQALRALGFKRSDLYLTIGKDSVGGPETVLIVRSNSKYYMLDDTGGGPVLTTARPEFRPAITCGYEGLWIHGYPLADRGTESTKTRQVVDQLWAASLDADAAGHSRK